MFGILNLNKPINATSRDVVDVVARLVRPAKAGHAGTLDPLATGVLLVAVGDATRLIEYLHQVSKTYVGTFRLGVTSNTEDVTGEVVELKDAPQPTLEQVAAALPQWTGTFDQRPPVFSALKVGGRRAYKLARAGQHVELAPRPVTVHRLEIVEYQYPRLKLLIQCSSGTYIRSLGRDIAQSLGTAAVMTDLLRTAIGAFRIDEAISPNQLTRENVADYLCPAVEAVRHLPHVALDEDQIGRLANGQSITLENPPPADRHAAGVDHSRRLVSILAARSDSTWKPVRNFKRAP